MDRSSHAQQLLENAIPLYEVDGLIFSQTDALMVAWIDVAKRPSLAFLLDPQEVGDFFYTFYTFHETTKEAIILIYVKMQHPQTEFSLAFPVTRCLKSLLVLARHGGKLWITPGPRSPHFRFPKGENDTTVSSLQGIIIEFDQRLTTTLREWLHMWREQHFDT